MVASVSLSPDAFIGWFEKIKNNLSDYRPETRSMMINFSKRTSTIGFQITIPEGFRKNHNKLKIPNYPGFNILRMKDEVFQEHKHLWKHVDDYHFLDAKDLPSSERYLVELEGSIDENALKKLVHIKPAANRDNDDENDKYWLDSSIKQPDILDKIWDDLEIEEVNVGVYVDIDKMFGLTIPEEIKMKTDAIDNLLTTSRKFDRTAILKSAVEYKRQERIAPSFSPGHFYQLLNKLTARSFLLEHIEVDKPYDIGNVTSPEKFVGLIPQNIKVQTLTTLTLRKPTALGYLKFKRKLYMDKLRKEFKQLS